MLTCLFLFQVEYQGLLQSVGRLDVPFVVGELVGNLWTADEGPMHLEVHA